MHIINRKTHKFANFNKTV